MIKKVGYILGILAAIVAIVRFFLEYSYSSEDPKEKESIVIENSVKNFFGINEQVNDYDSIDGEEISPEKEKTISQGPGREEPKKGVIEDEYRNQFIRVKSQGIQSHQDGFLLDLMIQNVSGEEIWLAFDDNEGGVYLKGNDGGVYLSGQNVPKKYSGLSRVYFEGLVYKYECDWFGPDDKTTVSILFLPIEGGKKNDMVFTFNSRIVCSCKGEIRKMSVGFGGIRL
ncbi:hypothetical protein CR161_03735 [Prosthecochloris sp. ZM]|uniref:hypothetical protein n=1 Tax=Prosthecochloris sp. ZM TaxID=2283143 RepID=UPI000DF8373D|nr:hypothetical protein [Prosthecochloris sp. ZM]RDD29890.1 hypothetical protein CR161_03735 [Prosthecochloris sp. ZM]